jgi:hypothetical protein
MSEWLIRVVDKVNDDPVLDAQCMKRGDVVVVCPDGWQWSQAELDNPEWRVLKCPGITETEAASFLVRELETDPQSPSRFLRRRAFAVDLEGTNMPKALREWSKHGHAEQAKPKTLRLGITDMHAKLRQRKPVFVDPHELA